MTKKILIVDDSKGWLDYHSAALKEIFGGKYDIEKAYCARDAYDMVYNNLEESYCLIVSDLQMELDFEPKFAGEWFVEQVKKMKEYQNTPIIIISATYNIRDIAKRLGVNCLPKAIAARDLTAYKLAMEETLKG